MFKKFFSFLILIIVLSPLLYLLSISFIDSKSLIEKSYTFKGFSNFIEVLSDSLLLRSLALSLITAFSATIIRALVIFLAAYAYMYTKAKFRSLIYYFLLITMLIPPDILLIQNYLTISHLNLLNTSFAIISTSLFGPTQLFMQQQFFSTLPIEYLYMAKIDGCSDYQEMKEVLMPLSIPIISIICLQTFINTFNAYLWPLLVTNDDRMRTIQIRLTMQGYLEALEFSQLAASVVVASLFTIIILIIMKKPMIKHLSRYQMLS